MALMGSCCRTPLAHSPRSTELLARRAERPRVVGVGEHDRFQPPRRLAPAVSRTTNLDVRVFFDVGGPRARLNEAAVSLVARLSIGP